MVKTRKTKLNHFYDMEILKDLCGCLIRYESAGVAFAHYTVQEYLKRSELYGYITGPSMDEYIQDIILTESLQLHQKRIHRLVFSPNFVVNKDMNKDLHIYYAISSLRSLGRLANESTEQTLALAFDLLNPTKDHFATFKTLTSLAWRTKWFSQGAGLVVISWACISWKTRFTKTELMPFFNLLFLIMDDIKIIPLLHGLLKSNVPGEELFKAQLSFTNLRDNRGNEFSGTVIDVIAQLTYKHEQFIGIFQWILRDNPSITYDIATYMLAHRHSEDCHHLCALEHFLENDGDPNKTGYAITLLQIAATNVDYEGVCMLVKAGADVNRIGDVGERFWREEDIVLRFGCHRGESPLRIIRRRIGSYKAENLFHLASKPLGYSAKKKNMTAKEKIESILVEHGAEDFAYTHPWFSVF